jgi:hypothetical protein
MANFKSLSEAIVSATLEFTDVSNTTLQQFFCSGGELAGFRILTITALAEPYYISQIYDCSTGVPIQVGNVTVIPGIDLTGGYFSSGCFADSDPLVQGCKFYKVDY